MSQGPHLPPHERLILYRTYERQRHFGIPESDFELLDGRVNMITKAPIRLLTLAQLDLRRYQTLWDIGFCTGSVSIEAKLQFPHLHVVAFEQRPEGERLMEVNATRFGTPGIITRIGDFLQAELDDLPAPGRRIHRRSRRPTGRHRPAHLHATSSPWRYRLQLRHPRKLRAIR